MGGAGWNARRAMALFAALLLLMAGLVPAPAGAAMQPLHSPLASASEAARGAGTPASFRMQYTHLSAKSVACKIHQWCSVVSTHIPVRVWTTGTGSASSDALTLSHSLAILEEVFEPMVAFMGPPLPDAPVKKDGFKKEDGNTDSRIDVYVVGPYQPVRRGGKAWTVGGNLAITPQVKPARVSPSRPHASSAAVLLRQDMGAGKGYRSTLVHELFHVLQFEYDGGWNGGCDPVAWWFAEASATWAESYFVPETAAQEVYTRYALFQGDDTDGLDYLHEDHQYASFIWPYFMQQTAGANSIRDAWVAQTAVQNCTQAEAALDKVFPFATHFGDFSLRNLNDPAFGTVSPITPRYSALHADFPEGVAPYLPKIQNGAGVQLQGQRATVPPLQVKAYVNGLVATYYHYTVDTATTGSILFDFSKLQNTQDLNLNAVVHENGTWKVLRWTGNLQPKLCLDTEPVDEMYLVLGDHNENSRIEGDFSIQPKIATCKCPDPSTVASFRMTANFHYANSAANDDEAVNIERKGSNLTAVLKPTEEITGFQGPLLSGQLSAQDTWRSGDLTSTIVGSGAPNGDTDFMRVDFDLEECRYNVTAGGTVDAVETIPNIGSKPSAVTDTFNSGWKPMNPSFTFQGQETVPAWIVPPISAWDTGWWNTNGLTAGYMFQLTTLLGGSDVSSMSYGTATVDWSLTSVKASKVSRGARVSWEGRSALPRSRLTRLLPIARTAP